MSRTEDWQLSQTNYPFTYQLETRFQDVDMLGHINNVAMAALFEAARVRFNMGYDHAWRERDRRVLLASITIDYLAESYFPEPMLLACGISGIGTSSWQIAQAAFQYKRGKDQDEGADETTPSCVAVGVSTMVLADKSGSIAMPQKLRDALQEQSVHRNRPEGE